METDAKLIQRQDQLENLESSRAIFDSFLTPVSLFYVRNHFDVPALDRSGCQLIAELLDTPRRYCWVRWQYDWNTPGQTSTVELMARASDTSGRSQPFSRAEDERHYSIHHVLPVRVQVGVV